MQLVVVLVCWVLSGVVLCLGISVYRSLLVRRGLQRSGHPAVRSGHVAPARRPGPSLPLPPPPRPDGYVTRSN